MQTGPRLPLAQNRSLLLELQVDEDVPACLCDPLRTRQIRQLPQQRAQVHPEWQHPRARAAPAPARRDRAPASASKTPPPGASRPISRPGSSSPSPSSTSPSRAATVAPGWAFVHLPRAGPVERRRRLSSSAGEGATFWPTPSPPRPASPPRERADDDIQRRRVLMVEGPRRQHADRRRTVGAMGLLKWFQASDGAQAAEAAARCRQHWPPFDIILMDVHMPVMGGHEAIASELRRDFGRSVAAYHRSHRRRPPSPSATTPWPPGSTNDFLTKPLDPPSCATRCAFSPLRMDPSS